MNSICIPELINHNSRTSGIDSLKSCDNKSHYLTYKKQVRYKYNSRGFRDNEWPENLSNCIWCVGDSFTAGLGQPQDETWPTLLSNIIKKPTINVSMDGASNEWCSRTASNIIKQYIPKFVVIQWLFISRREINDNTLSDMERRIWCNNEILTNTNEIAILRNNIINTINCIKTIEHVAKKSRTILVHTFIPNFDKTGYIFPDNSTHIWDYARKKLNFDINSTLHSKNNIQLDFARDGFHYDLKTACKYANKITKILNNV